MSAAHHALFIPLAASAPLAAPTDFTATAAADHNHVNLAWSNVPSGAVAAIQRSEDGGLTYADLVAIAGNTFTDATARATLYLYRIASKTYSGLSAYADPVSIITPPAEVAAFHRTDVSDTSASFAWTAVDGATSYLLESSSDGDAFTTALVAPAGSTSGSVSGLVSGEDYVFRISARNAGGASDPVTVIGVLTVPVTPQNLRATTSPDNAGIALSFSRVPGATSYLLERRTEGRGWGTLATLLDARTTYTDIQVDGTQTYHYRVTARNESGNSQPSSEIVLTLGDTGVLLPTPAQLVTSASGKNITLNWTLPGPADTISLQEQVKGEFKTVATYPGSTTSAPLKGIKSATVVRLIAAAGGSQSSPSQELTVQPLPATIKGVRLLNPVTPGPGATIPLAWPAPAGATLYKVERSTDKTTWTTLIADSPTAAYNDAAIVPGTTYYYRVSAGNPTGFAGPSSPYTIITPPATPPGLTVDGTTLAWPDVTGETGYRIQASPDGVTWSQLAIAKPNATTLLLKAPGKYPFYRIQAFNKSGSSPFSLAASSVQT